MSFDLSKFKENENAEGEKDVLGGGGYLVDSDAYDATIEIAYLGQSEGGANSLTVVLDLGDSKKLRETIWFTNKQGGTTFEKDGKINNLPGFNQVNGLCLLATGGKALADCTVGKATYPIWDTNAGKELPKEVEVLEELKGQKIVAGILRVIEDKQKKNEATGKYEPTGETREINTIDKFFQEGTRRTVTEIKAGEENGVFIDAWIEKKQGQVINKAKGTSVKSGIPGQAAASAPTGEGKSLFAK